MPRNVNSLENIFAKAIRDEESGCLLYMGSADRDGYPNISFHGKTYRANRLVYQLLQGLSTLPRGRDVHHACNNRRCIEPTHLATITHRQNILATEKYSARRKQRLRALLDYSPVIEFLPRALSSNTLHRLWGCRSDNVPAVLASMSLAYPEQFSWTRLKKGKGRTPAMYEICLQSSLIEHLSEEEKSRFSSLQEHIA